MIRTYVVAVTTPGTPQSLFAAINAQSGKVAQVSGGLSGPVDVRARGLMFQADPANTAASVVYVGSADLNVGSKVGIGLGLAVGAISPFIVCGDVDASLSDIWFDISSGATVKNLFVTVVD